MKKKLRKTNTRSRKELEQAAQNIIEQTEGQPGGKRPAKYRKASDDTRFQMELAREYTLTMGRYL